MILPLMKATSLVVPANLEDIPDLADIHMRCFAKAWKASEFQSLLQDKTVSCLIQRRSSFRYTDKIVGFVLVRSVVDEAEILTIAVDPDFQNEGIGAALMQETMRRLYADRVAKLFLEVDAVNKPALSLYQNLGFEQVGERKGYYKAGRDEVSLALIMQRSFTANQALDLNGAL